MNTPVLLLKAAHAGPALAVTVVTGLLAVSAGHDLSRGVLVVLAVFFGQLVIGWSNDLIDARRDAAVHRADKPLATGELSLALVRTALAIAMTACVVLSLMLGWRSGCTHLVLGVGSGIAYNLMLKSTQWSWLPYALAFGALPAIVTLALPAPVLAPVWMMLTGALLGVGAHLVNALPDLEDDAATGVRGLPHRLGARTSQVTATSVLLLGSVVAVVGSRWPPRPAALVALAVTVALASVAVRGTGRTPFRAAMAIALVDVAMLTALG